MILLGRWLILLLVLLAIPLVGETLALTPCALGTVEYVPRIATCEVMVIGLVAYDDGGTAVAIVLTGMADISEEGEVTFQSYDAETKLVYLRNRYYDPALGSFTQVDPARDGNNWHGYAGGDPVNRWDPSGLDDVRVEGDLVYWEHQLPDGTKVYDSIIGRVGDSDGVDWTVYLRPGEMKPTPQGEYVAFHYGGMEGPGMYTHYYKLKGFAKSVFTGGLSRQQNRAILETKLRHLANEDPELFWRPEDHDESRYINMDAAHIAETIKTETQYLINAYAIMAMLEDATFESAILEHQNAEDAWPISKDPMVERMHNPGRTLVLMALRDDFEKWKKESMRGLKYNTDMVSNRKYNVQDMGKPHPSNSKDATYHAEVVKHIGQDIHLYSTFWALDKQQRLGTWTDELSHWSPLSTGVDELPIEYPFASCMQSDDTWKNYYATLETFRFFLTRKLYEGHREIYSRKENMTALLVQALEETESLERTSE